MTIFVSTSVNDNLKTAKAVIMEVICKKENAVLWHRGSSMQRLFWAAATQPSKGKKLG